jgi:hypothetical protein
MGVFDPANLKIGAGVLYAAPLGNTEPTSVTGAWPSGWTPLGFTDQGSSFAFGPQTAAVEVEELFWPVEQAIVSYSGKLTFVLAETTRQNLAFALNCGITAQENQGSNSDGSLWQEPVTPGGDVRVMLGWDSIDEQNGSVQTTSSDPYGRIIIRQALQTGMISTIHRKGNNKTMYSCEFALEYPKLASVGPTTPSNQPFRFIFEPDLAA